MSCKDTKPKGLFVTDLDGTLLRSDGTFADSDLEALDRLGTLRIIRVIATGRSIFSFKSAVDSNKPVDYVVFSNGAGVLKHPESHILKKESLSAEEVNKAIQVFRQVRLDFMVHRPIPDNHMFAFWRSNAENVDFEKRLSRYETFSRPLDGTGTGFGPATQLLGVAPPSRGIKILEIIQEALPGFNIIRTTSPLDGKSIWIELFPYHVSKGSATAWLSQRLGLKSESVCAVGNDYNDTTLLEWSGSGFVVENAPEDLRARFSCVASNDNCGVTNAVKRWLGSRSSEINP